MGVFSDAKLESGVVEGVTESLGPTKVVHAEGFLDEGDPINVEVLLVDWPQPLSSHRGCDDPASGLWSSESEGAAEDPFTRLSGAKGSLLRDGCGYSGRGKPWGDDHGEVY